MNQKKFSIAVMILLGVMYAGKEIQSAERIPVLIDTDIGTDIDDAFALGLALGSYELDVRGITTVGDDARQKAMMLCRFLTVTGRSQIRVAIGANPQPSRPITDQSKYYYHPDALFDRTMKPEKQSAVEFLHQRMQQPGKITFIALGPLTNLARLIETHEDSAAAIHRVILLESNVALDIAAAQKVFTSGIPLLVVTADATGNLALDESGVKKVFSPGTALTRQIETLYQMWDKQNPPLDEALAVALSFDQRRGTLEKKVLNVNDRGELKAGKSAPNALVVTAIKLPEFVDWYVDRMSSLVNPLHKPSRVLSDNKMPHRVHVAEDFESDIERFWWMSGKPETKLLPAGSQRACRGVLTHDFDGKLMVSRKMYSSVIFNPVPGPPMSEKTRLRFRYWLKGTDTLRVQIYSLTNGYHRQLVVTGLPEQAWQLAVVDMTDARRPDGTGGPLGENERIDDIQFYVDPDAELVIDDIMLYEAADEGEQLPFPQRIMFTGLFDTGKQGEQWPGDFEIFPDAGNYWKAARSVENADTSLPWIRLHLRGERQLGEKTALSFRYRLTGTEQMEVQLRNSKTGKHYAVEVKQLQNDAWSETKLEFKTSKLPTIDEIHFLMPKGGDLLLDDVLLYEPGSE